MNPLLHTYDFLAAALTADPLLLLASAVATFDPLWADDERFDDEPDPLTLALHITRGAFPDIYAETVERLRTGASHSELDRLLCQSISAKGIPLDDLEMLSWGVPLTAVGVDLEDPEFYALHPDVLPALEPFGIALPDGHGYTVDVPQCVYTVGCAIATSLHEQTDPALRQVGWLYGWLFSCTDNSLVDYTEEALYEIQPLSWTPDDLDFAIEMIAEADTIMRDVQAGLDMITTTPELMIALKRNIAILSQQLKRKGKLDERTIRLEWTGACGGTDGSGIADTLIL